MKMSKDVYCRFAKAHAPKSPLLRDCFHAFWVGGTICVIGQLLRDFYGGMLGLPKEQAGMLTSATLILVAVLLTGLKSLSKSVKEIRQ